MRKRMLQLLALGMFFLTMILSGCGGGGYTGPTYSLSGTILQTDDTPMEGVVIHFGSEFGTTTTDSEGNWSMSDLHGTVTVTPVLAGWSFSPASQEVTGEASGISMEGTEITGSVNVIFLHHSTGWNVWSGGDGVPDWFNHYNTNNGTSYNVTEESFTESGNNPYDFWNRWVNIHSGTHSIEALASTYNVIIWKHCFPVSNVGSDPVNQEVDSPNQTIENYKLQYAALKTKMLSYPGIKFIVWTGAAQTSNNVSSDDAARARQFFNWVKTEWDDPGDNIFIWDFYELETEGTNYLKNSYASGVSPDYDSHPNGSFCSTVAPYFCNRIVDVIEGRGDTGHIDGKP